MNKFPASVVRRLYYHLRLRSLESTLDRHPTAKTITGTNLSVNGQHLGQGLVELHKGLAVDAEGFGRLFLLPDGSQCVTSVQQMASQDSAPPGLYVQSNHGWIQAGHTNSVGLYSEVSSRTGVFIDGVFVDHIFMDKANAPSQFGAVGFGLLALTAYQIGFEEITLLAAGGAPRHAGKWSIPDMVGYKVWPKFGFDAPLEPHETDSVPQLATCRTVNDVRNLDLDWWENKEGNGRVMRFDLSPWSKSWKILLHYVTSKKEFQ